MNFKTIIMKNYILIAFTFLVSFQGFCQNDSIDVKNSREYYNAFDDYFKTVSIQFGAGLFVPQGQLQNYFGTAPLFELNANFPLKKGRSIDGVLQLVIPNQQDDFAYLRTIDTVQAKSTLMFNAFLRLKKHIHHSQDSKVNLGLGIGASTISTNARNPFYDGKDDENKYELITAFLLMPGVEWSHKFSKNNELIFSFEVQYSPYKIEGALREDIGGVALIPKLSYRF